MGEFFSIDDYYVLDFQRLLRNAHNHLVCFITNPDILQLSMILSHLNS